MLRDSVWPGIGIATTAVHRVQHRPGQPRALVAEDEPDVAREVRVEDRLTGGEVGGYQAAGECCGESTQVHSGETVQVEVRTHAGAQDLG